MRTCPKCGDFYADDSSAFCLDDGTPLVGVEPHGESWSEGTRVVEEKERAQRRRMRRLKWRRVLMSVTTMLVVTLVVCVVVVNSVIYLRPQTETDATPTPALDDSPTPTPDEPTPTPTPTATPTPSPTPSPTPTPPPPACSAASEGDERAAVVKSAEVELRRKLKVEQGEIIAAHTLARVTKADRPAGLVIANRRIPANDNGRTPVNDNRRITVNDNRLIPVAEVKATLFELRFDEPKFPKACRASVTVKYFWRVNTKVNGTSKDVDVPKEKTFACKKRGDKWRCR